MPSKPSPASAAPARPRRSRLRTWSVRLLFAVVALVTVAMLLLEVSRVRGRRAWERCESALRANGHPVYLRDVVPPQIPDEENMVATPFWIGLFDRTNMQAVLQRYWPDTLAEASSVVNRHGFDLDQNGSARAPAETPGLDVRVWALALRTLTGPEGEGDLTREQVESLPPGPAATEVLGHLKGYDPLLDEIRRASHRPKARYAIDYSTRNPAAILLPHLTQVRNVCRLLHLRVAAHAAAGNTAQADADLQLMFAVVESLRDEPTLISFLVRLSGHQLVADAFRDAHATGDGWPEPVLAQWQSRWSGLDFIADAHRILRGERTFGNSIFEMILNQPDRGGYAESLGVGGELDLLLGAMPTGWIYHEQVNYNTLFDRLIGFQSPPGAPHLDPTWVRGIERHLQRATRDHGYAVIWKHRLFSGLLLPSLTGPLQKAAQAQAMAHMALLNCALARHRLTHGRYPSQLDDLIPRFIDRLPLDVVSDQPYQYRLDSEGAHTLWSVGWNQADDQAQVSKDKDEGDWVWGRRPITPDP